MRLDEQQVLWGLLDSRDKTVQGMGAQLLEKEVVIQQLIGALAESQAALAESQAALAESQAALAESEVSLIEKQSIILVLSQSVTEYRLAHILFNPTRIFKKIVRRGLRLISPRLGNLNQYAPVPLRHIPTYTSLTAQANLPTISIVTPSFRQGNFIERTLLSVLNQNYSKLEYHVQDGGSPDQTTTILKRYEEQLSSWSAKKDSGQSQAINHGFANTSGEIMALLNSDDLLLPNALAIVADYFNRHPDVDVVYGNRLLIDEYDMEIGRWIMPGHDSDVLSWVDYVPQETMFWRRRIWDKIGGQVDESFRFAMDWDLLVRFRDAGAKFAHIPRFLGAFRIHAHQKTSAAINEIGHKEMNRIRERLHGKVPTRKDIHKSVLPFMLKHVAVDMVYRVKMRLGGKK
jgi:GT2 family glycosyltransferase